MVRVLVLLCCCFSLSTTAYHRVPPRLVVLSLALVCHSSVHVAQGITPYAETRYATVLKFYVQSYMLICKRISVLQYYHYARLAY